MIVDGGLDLAAATRWDRRCDAASLHLFSDVVEIVAAIGHKDVTARLWPPPDALSAGLRHVHNDVVMGVSWRSE